MTDSNPSPRRLYSPGTIATYTVLANLPMGMILSGAHSLDDYRTTTQEMAPRLD